MPQQMDEVKDAQTGITTQIAVPWTVEAAKSRLKELRFTRETSGIIVDGVPISTERGDHRTTMLSLALAGSQNPGLSVAFKLADGSFKTMTGAFAAAAWAHGQGYVAQCFAVEAAASAAIDAAESDAEIDAIFAAITWPLQEFTT